MSSAGPTTRTPETFKVLLKKVTSKEPSLTQAEAKLAIEHLLDPASTHPAQIGSFLTALHLSGLERSPDVIAGAAEVLLEHCVPANIDRNGPRIVDIVGTGGDGHNTFNVSTTAAIVAAGAGARVYKHGNRASTSSSGSADLLQALGCPLSPPSNRTHSADAVLPPFQFLLAPNYHPLLAPLGPIRKSLPHRTLFNLLGPLVNPARPSGIVIGVAHQSLGHIFAKALQHDSHVEHALVVCGAENLDEISIAGPTTVWEYYNGHEGGFSITESSINPTEHFGVPTHPLETVKGGDAAENANTFERLLKDRVDPVPQDLQPVLDFVLVNASAVLVVARIARGFDEGVTLARESISSGKAWAAFEAFRKFDNGLPQE